MEWLSHLVANEKALQSYLDWIKVQEDQCVAQALDVSMDMIPALKAKRDVLRNMQAYIQNSVVQVKRDQENLAV